jgi:penicillin-binding protein 2
VRIYEDLRAVQTRVTVLQYGTVIMIGLLLVTFWHLQVVRAKYYRNLAENNRRRNVPIAAPRGILFDRNEQILVENRPSFNVVLSTEHPDNLDQTVAHLSRLLQVGEAPIRERLPRRGAPPRDVVVKSDASIEDVASIEARRLELPQAAIQVVPLRSYPLGVAAAHVLGYVGEVNEQQLQRAIYQGSEAGDIVGQFGVEQQYNRWLRGKDGLREVIVNSRGVEVDEAEMRPPVVGPSVTLTIDAKLQTTLEQSFAGRSGAAVALDPRTGEILAMTSLPAFDPNRFSTGVDTALWRKLISDPETPLLNRVVQGTYAPGSVFKIVMSIAALEEKVITPETRFHCNGLFSKYGKVFHCHNLGPHGWVNLEQAIAASCNVYFYNVGVLLEIDRIARYAKRLGLGAPTGIDLPHEESGVMPSPEWKQKKLKQPWYAGETVSVAIGQGYVTTTALQLARLAAAAATGKLVTPHLVKRVVSETWSTTPPLPQELGFRKETLDAVRRGMRAVAAPGGTGWRAGLPGIVVCGKTGTAQIVTSTRLAKDKSDENIPHGWFVAFAPMEDPQIALAIMVEHGASGGGAAAPIARDVFAQFFGVKVTPRPPAAVVTDQARPAAAPSPSTPEAQPVAVEPPAPVG